MAQHDRKHGHQDLLQPKQEFIYFFFRRYGVVINEFGCQMYLDSFAKQILACQTDGATFTPNPEGASGRHQQSFCGAPDLRFECKIGNTLAITNLSTHRINFVVRKNL